MTSTAPTFAYVEGAPLLAQVFNSAVIGYEKPNPGAFQTVLNALPDREAIWMIGDNIVADIQGAEAVGLPAILVRRSHPDARLAALDLTTVSSLLPSI